MDGFFETLCAAIAARDDFQRKFLANNPPDVSAERGRHAETYLRHALGQGETIESLADQYLRFVAMTNEEQHYFVREGRYRHSTLAEVEQAVYGDPEYMRMYMHGLALSNFLWPQHRKLFDFFDAYLDTASGGEYLEIGPGHGMFFLQALTRGGRNCLGVDISQGSLDMTRAIVGSLPLPEGAGFDLRRADFLHCDFDRLFDSIVMGEVLEHVERPDLFLERIAGLLRPGGTAFITTCVNSPAIDHIMLFGSVEDVEKLFSAAGMTVRDSLHIPYAGKSLEQCRKRKFPVNVGYVLSGRPQ